MNSREKQIIKKAGEVANSLKKLSGGNNQKKFSYLLFSLNDISKSMKSAVKEFSLHSNMDNLLTKIRLSTELDDARIHLSLLESFGYMDTKRLKLKVDELSFIIKQPVK